jgi:SAM-dependent methyltransferase
MTLNNSQDMTPSDTPYSRSFYENISGDSFRSAQLVVPVLMELLNPKSVVDVGSGTGAWLKVFEQYGAEYILGLDGDYVNQDQLIISPTQFQPQDLREIFTINRKFDLVVSLEVAEHLPKDNAVDFVKSLTNLGSVIFFSAAIPFQPGTDHINCQWPDYWADLFFEHGYIPLDCLRQRFWHHNSIAWWYAQNMMLFIHEDFFEGSQILMDLLPPELTYPPRLVHPELYIMQQAKYFNLVNSINSKA